MSGNGFIVAFTRIGVGRVVALVMSFAIASILPKSTVGFQVIGGDGKSAPPTVRIFGVIIDENSQAAAGAIVWTRVAGELIEAGYSM